MDELRSLMQVENADGTVKTYLGGRFTSSQMIVGVVCLLLLVFVLAFAKKIAKVVLSFVIVAVVAIHYGLASPQQVKDMAGGIASTGADYYKMISQASDSVKFDGTDVKVKIDGTWYSVSALDKVISSASGLTVEIGGNTYSVQDNAVVEVIKTFLK